MYTGKKIIEDGISEMNTKAIAICSIVRDCNKNLTSNIPQIEELRKLFKKSFVIIFENDSIDATKETLKNWSEKSENIYCVCEDQNEKTIVKQKGDSFNRYFAEYRISRMANYRNRYLQKIEDLQIDVDYVMVIDLDIEKMYLSGIIHSFGLSKYWDVITSDGYSFNPLGRKRYHDSYACVELGMENVTQTEESIVCNQKKFRNLKSNFPLIAIFSAHGGMSIYKKEAIINKRYKVYHNDDTRVQVKCEHFALCSDIRDSGFNRIFINPAMKLRYQSIDFKMIKSFFFKILFKIKD